MNYAHKKLVEQILLLDKMPADQLACSTWVEAKNHIQFLMENAQSDEIVIYASGGCTFIHSIIVPNLALTPIDRDDLLKWSDNPYTGIASYVTYGNGERIRIERARKGRGSRTLDQGRDLIFCRKFEGFSDNDATYIEANQEYTHLSGIHWRQEFSAYCHFDDNGDIQKAISVSTRNEKGIMLVSFARKKLEEYLVVSDCSLVRMFEFTFLDNRSFSGTPAHNENTIECCASLFYRQKLANDCSYTRGLQIIDFCKRHREFLGDAQNGCPGQKEQQYVEFLAHDWRNQRLVRISTAPEATTNYFTAHENDLPYELSPAFFRPEVLSKYKTDRQKYTISTRDIHCRAAWSLRGYDVNEAGQVHAYICYLRALPYSEQLHWLSYNEEPKERISERAIVNDFMGEFITFTHPREEIISIVRRWHDNNMGWWTLRDEGLLDRANPPLTTSRDEWADAFMDLSQLVVEGFNLTVIRQWADKIPIACESSEKSISILEKLLNHGKQPKNAIKLQGLRDVQAIRNKVKGHSGDSEKKKLSDSALAQHGSYDAHFKHICKCIVPELEAIEQRCESL